MIGRSTLVRENLAMAAEASRLQRLFDEACLRVLFLKGSSLAMLAFGNIGLTGSQDIDLLVPRRDALCGNGVGYSRRLSPFRSSASHQ